MDYLQLITSEHKNQPKFAAWLSAALGMIQDVQNFLLTMQNSFDLDRAVGNQLDTIGEVLNMPRLLPFQPNEIYSLQVNGVTTETGAGEKAPDNPFTLVGTQSITVSGNPSQSANYAISPPAYGITPDVCDTVDVVTGQRTSDVEIKTLDGTEPWQYDEQSLNTATGDGISVVDSQDGGEFTSLVITGKVTQDSPLYETVTDKMFLASTTEVGLANENGVAEGSLLAAFSDSNSRLAYPTTECVSNSEYTNSGFNASSPWNYWLRTPTWSVSQSDRRITATGNLDTNTAYSGSMGIRPFCNLLSSWHVSDTPDTDGSYEIIWNVSSTKTLGDLNVNDFVKDSNLLYYGAPIIWKIVDKNHTGYPSNSVTLMSNKILTLKCFDATEPTNPNADRAANGNNRYSVSNIRQWLNNDAAAGNWYSAQHTYDAPPTNANVWNNIDEYDQQAGFLNGFSQNFKDALLPTILIVAKNQVTDYVMNIHATNSVAVTDGSNTQNIALPQTLYSLPNDTSDVYNIISGQGTQKIKSLNLTGSESWAKAAQSTSTIGVFTLTVSDAALTSEDGAVISTRFNHSAQSGTYTPIAGSISLTTDAHQIRIATDVTTDLATFKTWLSTHNDTVLYELTSAQTITGTPQTVQTYSTTSVYSDGGGNISATYVTNSPVLYAHCSYPLSMIGHCTHFKDDVYDLEWYDGEQGIGYAEDVIHLKIPKSFAKTVPELKTWLSGQTVQFVSQRDAPEVTQGTGQTITVYSPVTNVYRDDGTLIGTYDIFSPVMTDEVYRIVLKAVVADAHFIGTPESLYNILQNSLGDTGLYFSVVDNQNMSMSVVAFGATNPAIQALIQRGMIVPRPEGVQMNAVVSTNKVFGWDAESDIFGGWDEGYWLP